MKKTTLLFPMLAALALPAVAQDEKKVESVAKIFPEKLENAKGEEVSHDVLTDKIVAIYFSAHWCPPCRAFTPSLVEFHKKNKGDDFEIVFVSFDNSEAEKAKYISEVGMEWLSVAGNRSDVGNALGQKYGVRGIPALVVLAPDGSVITKEGRADVSGNADGALAKWKKEVEG
ncbi:MAG: redoxin domain-containing protein [Verrucomicrobiales bacterium]|nr:redoxin domain-containing protein [Verrucomicrobiales bacterium]